MTVLLPHPRVPRRVRWDGKVSETTWIAYLAIRRLYLASLCDNRPPLWEWRIAQFVDVPNYREE